MGIQAACVRATIRLAFGLLLLGTTLPRQALAQNDDTVTDIVPMQFDNGVEYPPLAWNSHTQGAVVVRLQLDSRGNVSEAKAISGSRLLIEAPLESAKKWKFKPNAQKAPILVYLFRIKGICASNDERAQVIFEPPNLVSVTICGPRPQP